MASFVADDRTVFFLGAGASVPEGAPTNENLLSVALEIGSDDDRVVALKKFLDRCFPRSRQKGGILPTFEEVLTFVDTSLRRQESFSGSYGLRELEEVRENLLFSLCMTLDETLRGPRGRLHMRLLNALSSRHLLGRDSSSFITTNYDILLDNALLPFNRIDIDYGIHFRNEGKGKDWEPPRTGRGVRVLKLHGSLNWLLCTACNTVEVTPQEKGVMAVWRKFKVCSRDDSRQRPIIIPPAYQKVVENPYLTRIWLEAEQVLRRATKMAFIGYSLSEADSHVRYLLKRGIHGRRSPPVVWVVSRPNGLDDPTEARFRRFLGAIVWKPIGFEGFVDELGDFLDA